MNERLKEIERQCWQSTETKPYALFDVKKFAELIVRECVEQVITGVRTNPPQPQPPELVQTLVRRIEQHFGVEG